jgi:hypothetical protein
MTVAGKTGSAEKPVNRSDVLSELQLRPRDLRFYKPKNGQGAAVKFDLRLVPLVKVGATGDTYVKSVSGGLFLEMARELPSKDAEGNATFGWDEANTRITGKLGLPDVTSLLTAVRCRYAKRLLPDSYGFEGGDSVKLFHKFGDETTAIRYTLAPDGAFLHISKSKELQRKVKLSLQEELAMEAYLQHALNMFVLMGVR